MPSGYDKLTSATTSLRPTADVVNTGGGSTRGKPFPAGDNPKRLRYAALTNPNGSGATIYWTTTALATGISTATRREQTMIPIASGETFSWGSAERVRSVVPISFGTGYTYVHGSATTVYPIFSYLESDD